MLNITHFPFQSSDMIYLPQVGLSLRPVSVLRPVVEESSLERDSAEWSTLWWTRIDAKGSRRFTQNRATLKSAQVSNAIRNERWREQMGT